MQVRSHRQSSEVCWPPVAFLYSDERDHAETQPSWIGMDVALAGDATILELSGRESMLHFRVQRLDDDRATADAMGDR